MRHLPLPTAGGAEARTDLEHDVRFYIERAHRLRAEAIHEGLVRAARAMRESLARLRTRLAGSLHRSSGPLAHH